MIYFCLIFYVILSFFVYFSYTNKNSNNELFADILFVLIIVTSLSIITFPILIFLKFGFLFTLLYISIGVIYAVILNKKILEIIKCFDSTGDDGITIFLYILNIISNIFSPFGFYFWLLFSKIFVNNYFVSSFKKTFEEKETEND